MKHTGILLLALSLSLSCESTKHTPDTPLKKKAPRTSFTQARKEFRTKLTFQRKPPHGAPEALPPGAPLQLVQYPAAPGPMYAFLSPKPKQEGKHPIVIWRFGGFSNATYAPLSPEEPDNDQSGAQYRLAGALMMYPAVRGGSGNPGHFEGFYGEVDDMLSAIAYVKTLDYVDPQHVYIGGHSTGGTLALLTAAALPKGSVAGVFALGPVSRVSGYMFQALPFNTSDRQEDNMRAPIEWLDDIQVPTYMVEGEDGNSDDIEEMIQRTNNPNVHGVVLDGYNHFDVIQPLNTLFATKIMEAVKAGHPLKLSVEDILELSK